MTLRELLQRSLGLLQRRRDLDEIDEELAFHLEMETEANQRSGLDRDEALRQARMRLGGVTQTRELYRDQSTFRWLENLWGDFKHAARTLLREPLFTGTVLLVLALGIGANSTIFSVADAVLFRPLPYPDSEQLAFVIERGPDGDRRAHDNAGMRFVEDNLVGSTSPIESVALAGGSSGQNLVTQAVSERGEKSSSARFVSTLSVSESFFEVLGLPVKLGRDFTREDGDDAVIVSSSLWQEVFGSDREALGSVVRLGDRPVTVIGVAAAGIRMPFESDLYLPFVADFRGAGRNLSIFARVKGRSSLEEADVVLAQISPEWRRQRSIDDQDVVLSLEGLQSGLGQGWRPALFSLIGTVGLVLLISSANITSLVMARLQSRRRELAVRSAIGGGPLRLLQLVAVENLLLTLAGGALGIAIAALGLHVFNRLAPLELTSWDARIDWRVLLATLLFSLFCALVISIAPTLGRGVLGKASSLHGSTRCGSGRTRGRRLLVIAQLAVSFVLVVAAGLLIESLLRLQRAELGFDPEGLVAAEMSLQGPPWDQGDRVLDLFERGLDRLGRLPDVEAVTVGNNLPGQRYLNMPVTIPGRTDEGSGPLSVNWGYVGEDYFGTLGIPLVRGRDFDERDGRGGEPVALVNEALARQFYPGADVIGRRIEPYRFTDEVDDPVRTVIGVVADTQNHLLGEPASPAMYVPVDQVTGNGFKLAHGFFPVKWIVKTTGSNGGGGAAGLTQAMKEIAPEQPFSRVRTLREILAGNVADQRFLAVVVGLFAALGLATAAAGLYGLIAFSVARRGREIGVRLSLGATRSGIVRGVLWDAERMCLVGLVLGFAGALMTAQVLERLLAVDAGDPIVQLWAAIVLSIVGALAAAIPALSASRIDPAEAVRDE